MHPARFFAFEHQLHTFLHGQRRQLGQFFAHQFRQLHRLAHGVAQLRLDTRHGQQLAANACGAVDAVDQEVQGFAPLRFGRSALGVLCMDAQDRQWRAQFVGGVGDEAAFALQQVIHLHQQPVERGLHGLQIGRQRLEVQRLQGVGIAPPNRPDHGAQRGEPPADGQPDQHGQQWHADQGGPKGVAHDAFDQVLANVVALAHPDQQSLLRVGEEEGAPVVAVVHDVVGAEGSRRGCKYGRLCRPHQQLTITAPHLEGQASFVRVGHALLPHTAHGLVERLIQAVPVGFAGVALAQHTLQQARTLGELSVVDFFDFVVAVAQHQPADQRVAEQNKHQHRNEDARANRGHGVSAST